jgi:hypothetical protein
MPGFPLIQGFTEARLARGLDAKEVKEIKDFVLAGRAAPNDLQSEQLLRLTVLYADYFTPAAKGAWEKLTGIPVDKAEAHYRQHAKLYKNVLDARLDLSAEKTRIQHDHAATPSGRGVAVDSRFLAEDLAARTKTEPTPSEITHRDAVALELPPATYRRVLAGGGAVIDRLMQALADQEKHSGDGDGVLTPRDCKVAPRELAAVADALFTNLGPRALHLQRDVRPALGAAICDLVFSGPRNEARHSGVGKDLFVAASRDVLDALAREYQTQVVRGGEPFTLFLEKNGVRAPAHKTAVLKALEALVPPPTLKETAHLYALAASEKLSSNDFYTAARLEQRDVFQLQAEHPGHFPRAPGQKDTSALPARKVLGDLAESSLTDHHQVAQAWAAEVVTGQKSVEQFTIDHGLRSNVLMRMRKDHPTLFAAPPRNTGAHDASFARDLAAAFAAAAAKTRSRRCPSWWR